MKSTTYRPASDYISGSQADLAPATGLDLLDTTSRRLLCGPAARLGAGSLAGPVALHGAGCLFPLLNWYLPILLAPRKACFLNQKSLVKHSLPSYKCSESTLMKEDTYIHRNRPREISKPGPLAFLSLRVYFSKFGENLINVLAFSE